MALIDDVKLALRIQTNLLNTEITNTIAEAGAELIRSGVSSEVITADPGPLVRRAIITYCQMRLGNDKTMTEGFEKSFKYQQDCLRKSSGFMTEDDDDEEDDS